MTRTELEAAYRLTIPEVYRGLSLTAYSDAYLLARMAPAPKTSRRGPRIARHCNDEGAS